MRFPGHGRGPSDRRESVFHAVSGGHSEGETPGPIPNPEVKPFCADGTARGTAWESRTPPGIFERGCSPKGSISLFPFMRKTDHAPVVLDSCIETEHGPFHRFPRYSGRQASMQDWSDQMAASTSRAVQLDSFGGPE